MKLRVTFEMPMAKYYTTDPEIVEVYVKTYLEQAELNARDWVQEWLNDGRADTFVEITDDDGNSIHVVQADKNDAEDTAKTLPVGPEDRNLHLRRGPQAKRLS